MTARLLLHVPYLLPNGGSQLKKQQSASHGAQIKNGERQLVPLSLPSSPWDITESHIRKENFFLKISLTDASKRFKNSCSWLQFYTQNKNQTSPHAPKTFISEHNSNPNPAFPLRLSAQGPASRNARGERAGHTTQPLSMHPASLKAIPPASTTPLHLLGCNLVPEFVRTRSRRPAQTVCVR